MQITCSTNSGVMKCDTLNIVLRITALASIILQVTNALG